ncbi:FAD-binding domain-containing protein [Hyaloscypha hepaticicola]|uniref:FAD-binding domain-containing protein n=1 Tax=Hyaloscypha hepaticicola TaxID=2082293 RepID=A0A2J6QE46_9HELO|nr:FAD-binding domain-containing protein [Hyaloscypha hepaticicola]
MYFYAILFLFLNFPLKVLGKDEPLSIEQVSAQISTFMKSGPTGTISTSVTSSSMLSGCALACSFLNFALPGEISYPNSTTYVYEESLYWSTQQAITSPTCRFTPTCTSDVSLAVLTVQVTQCQSAVKSGGHAAFTGASNINGGLTIDLLKLNQITVSPDKTQTFVGPGNTWFDVYSQLEGEGLSVIGGRVSGIGVGGLTLGGGISFFSGRYGWACDNVNTYEVVFADGTIHEVSYASYPDLYFALRGGGNNFGIVTRFDLVTFPQGDLWAGSQTFIYDNVTAAALNEAFYYIDENSMVDPYAQAILAYAYVQSIDTYIIASDLQYGKPVANPPILQNFTSVPGAVANTLRITNLTGLTQEFNASNPSGFRQTYWTLTTQNSATLIADIVEIFMQEVSTIKDADAVLPSISFQPIGTDMISHFSKNGENALGISAADGPLNLINIVVSWSNEADDERIMAAARNLTDRANATAYAQGLGNRFIYQNYAALEQDVFEGYGEENKEKLRVVSERYDPKGVWQKLQPGYFKVNP